MPRFFCPAIEPAPGSQPGPVSLSDPAIVLDPEESHHAARVLRIEPGEAVEVFNGRGLSVTGMVASVKKSQVVITVTEATLHAPMTPQVWIAAAIAKGSRPDDMVDQLSQASAAGWMPLLTRRGVVDPRSSKVDKLRRTAVAAAKQSGRAHLMEVTDPMSLTQALAVPASLRLIAVTTPPDQPRSIIDERITQAEKIIIYVGPEGGWTDDETRQAIDAGCLPWSLGPSVMRIETAAVAAAVIAMYLSTR